MVMTSDVTSSSAASVVATRPRTLQMQSAEKRLTQALDNLRNSTPAQLFAGRYQLLSERVQGGQALVTARIWGTPKGCLGVGPGAPRRGRLGHAQPVWVRWPCSVCELASASALLSSM